MKEQKVFGIGFHKTGTTTLQRALKILGYKVTGPNLSIADNLKSNDVNAALEIAEKFDAFQDNPWPLLYQELDQKFPGSKFILTLRDEEKWINSIVNHFGTDVTSMREWIYGVGFPAGNESIYLQRFRKHNKDVQAYFSKRPDDLLILDWSTGDEWEKLCGFLNTKIPGKPFPHANKGAYSPGKRFVKDIKSQFAYLVSKGLRKIRGEQ